MGMKLYEIASDLRDILEYAEDESYKDTVEALQMEFEEKVDSIACYIKEIQAEAEAIKAEEKKLAERRKTKENRASSLKQYLYNEMKTTGMKKIETPRSVLSIRKSQVSLVIDNEDLFVDACLVGGLTSFIKENKPTLNKIAIKEAIKNGMELEGARLEAGESLILK